jgi:ABC-type glycerol-3-phosphate transport system permease component
LLILIAIIPIIGWIFGLVWIFISGFNGEKWALNNPENHYRDEAEFRLVMSTWNRAGLVNFIIAAAVIALYILFFVVVGFSFLNEFRNYGY